MTHTMHHGWVADERLWLDEVLADRAHGWIGMLEIVSLAALVGISVMGWLGVLAVLIRSLA